MVLEKMVKINKLCHFMILLKKPQFTKFDISWFHRKCSKLTNFDILWLHWKSHISQTFTFHGFIERIIIHKRRHSMNSFLRVIFYKTQTGCDTTYLRIWWNFAKTLALAPKIIWQIFLLIWYASLEILQFKIYLICITWSNCDIFYFWGFIFL